LNRVLEIALVSFRNFDLVLLQRLAACLVTAKRRWASFSAITMNWCSSRTRTALTQSAILQRMLPVILCFNDFAFLQRPPFFFVIPQYFSSSFLLPRLVSPKALAPGNSRTIRIF